MRKRISTPGASSTAVDVRVPAALRASVDGTARYAARSRDRFADGFYRQGLAGLTLSSIGIGTYLGDCDDAEDARYSATIARAFTSGINLVDTAINYRCQRSERAVGSAIEQVLATGQIARDELVVCTKGGFVPLADSPPESREAYREYLEREFFDTGVMTPDDLVAGGHSLAPGFLRYCITRSRRNLGVRTIDVYLLHNPEQQLATLAPQSFRERLRAAFMVLEDAVGRGEIARYGCATWTGLRVAPGTKGHLSLQELVEIAREVAGDRHHFEVVQLPISLAMPEAIRVPTQPLGRSRQLVPLLEAAAALGISVLASASLMQAQLAQGLPPGVRALVPNCRTDAQCALSFVRALPGVTSALVGMRTVAHLEENLESGSRMMQSGTA